MENKNTRSNSRNKGIRSMGSDPAEGTDHPMGESAGTFAGAIAGGAAGTVAGPIGTVAGAAIGGIAGWLEGRTIAEGINPQREIAYWKENFSSRPYYNKKYNWKDYETAYLYGLYTYDPDLDFEQGENDLDTDWSSVKGNSRLSADEAREASRDAWGKVARTH